MEEIEYKILQNVVEFCGGSNRYADAEVIAETLEMNCQDIADILDIMSDEGYVQTIHSADGCGAIPTPRGRLMIRHPDYMQRKGYAVACLNVLEEAVTKDNKIPEEEKRSIIQKIRALSNDPYVVNVGSGIIIEGLKKMIGV